VNDELQIVWKEAAVTQLLKSGIRLEELGKTTKTSLVDIDRRFR
jgi:hypothetical protein